MSLKLFLPNGAPHAVPSEPVVEATPETPKEYDYMEEGRQFAAQCWCDEETKGIPMDTRLAEACAKRIAAWMQTASQGYRGAEFYRDLLDECGRALGVEAYTSDDGSIQQDVLVLKVPELVKRLIPESEREARAASVPVVDEKVYEGEPTDPETPCLTK